MMRSMFTGVSGLKVHQTKMDVIGNNIANINTVGFKSSRVTFADVFSQVLRGASAANEATGKGGVNPMAVGLGAKVASIDLQMTQGSTQRTGNPFDLMIQGDSFFIVGEAKKSPTGQTGEGEEISVTQYYFTKAGAFDFDKDGNLLNSDSLKVFGWGVGADGKIDKSALKPIVITDGSNGTDNMKISEPKATENVRLNGNVNPVTDPSQTIPFTFYDTEGYLWVMDLFLDFDAAATVASTTPEGGGYNIWNYRLANEAVRVDDPSVKIQMQGTVGGQIYFDRNGNLVGEQSMKFGVLNNEAPPISDYGAPPAEDGNRWITIDFGGLTQFGEMLTNAGADRIDGYPPGQLIDMSIAKDGIITGRFTNDQFETFGQIAVTRFDNPEGLQSVGSNLFIETANSGHFKPEDVTFGGGSILSGVLEMSNVDLSQEFTQMIITQRGFQANSRIISTSDDMLQELLSLKR